MTRAGIIAYGAAIPVHRLDPDNVQASHGTPVRATARPVAGFDEDSTTLGVDAARRALSGVETTPEWIHLATTSPVYLEKTNAVTLHAALGLPSSVGATDLAGSLRGGTGALRVALAASDPSLAVLADVRLGRPHGAEEMREGDGAAAFLTSGRPTDVHIAELIGKATATEEYLDRWRRPSEPVPQHWEESFGAEIAVGLTHDALREALDDAGLTLDQIDHAVISGANARAVSAVSRASGIPRTALRTGLTHHTGSCGVAQAGLALADALDHAKPGESIVLIVVADGLDILIFEATDALPAFREGRARVIDHAGDVRSAVPYARYLAWRGLIELEAPRKAAPDPYVAPVAYRRRDFKYGLVASRCTDCGTRQIPPQRVCLSCQSIDRMEHASVREVSGRLVAHTVDRLAWSPSQPAVFGVIDLDGGGRIELELTDVGEGDLVPGRRMEFTFRAFHDRGGRRNYFWKARPTREDI